VAYRRRHRRRPGQRHRWDPAWSAAAAGIGLASAGWAVHSVLLAIAGVMVALTAAAAWGWGRFCLTAVSFTRTVPRERALFGERLAVDLEVVNDKLLPLAWLHVRDGVPPALPVEGAVVAQPGWRTELQLVLAMLPYQRVRRRITVVCSERGLHRFGPATLRSGSPFGTHERTLEVRSEASLLVYPKVFALSTTPVMARLPVPDLRQRRSMALDPSRVVGVRQYATGDPVRDIDWRASARAGDLLVRIREPAATPGVAVYVDLLPPPGVTRRAGADVREFLVSVAAPVVSRLLDDGVPTGLYTSGTARGLPVAVPPSRHPGLRTAMLEMLARVAPAGGVPIAETLARTRHSSGVSTLLIAADLPASTLAALGQTRRRSAVGAVLVTASTPREPSRQLLDAWWEVRYDDAWRERPLLEVTPR
jgi:uncharacterized protein (DUF58 family)